MATSTQWQLTRDAAERYEQVLVSAILGPAARALVEWSDLRVGEGVLDVGCGTGAAARSAAEKVGPSGRVVGVDVNAGMIDVARSLPPAQGGVIEWLENDINQLPSMKGEFDVALCAQTLQFLQDRPRALAEIRRVVKPNGRVAVSFWCDIEESPYFHELVQAVTSHIGAETALGLRTAFCLPDSATVHALLKGAGLKNVKTEVNQLDLELPKPEDFVPRHVSATPMSTGFLAASEEARQAVVFDVAQRLASYATDRGVRVPFRMHLMMGIR